MVVGEQERELGRAALLMSGLKNSSSEILVDIFL